ncbi:MAG: DUF1587 domain-containing protein, partial [Gammaproteobacteria bacterium]|nr:DUF1587 domain-containing protein [Gammaproteobacteria bacterium]
MGKLRPVSPHGRHRSVTIVLVRTGVLLGALILTGCARTGGDAIGNAGEAALAVERYCADCHNAVDFAGEFSFDTLDPARIADDPEHWERVVRKLNARMMPPVDAPRPSETTYMTLASWLENELDASANLFPGRPALRRLNRAEYANAIYDLLALEVDVAALLPPDDAAYGFDNIGDLLTVSPSLLERYLSAADRVSALAVGDPSTTVAARTYTVPGDQSQSLHLDGLPLGTVGGIGVTHAFPLDGEYEIAVGLFRTNLEEIRGLEHSHQLEIAIDGERVLLETIGGDIDRDRPGTTITERSDYVDARLRVRVPVNAGQRQVTATFVRKVGAGTNRLRPFDRSNAGTYDSTGRPHVETLTITGPHAALGPGTTASRERIFSCTPSSTDDEATCAREILTTLAERAYRRPVNEGDLDRLLPFYEQGRAAGTFDSGIQLALRRLLASPSFVFRTEADPSDVGPGEAYALSDL